MYTVRDLLGRSQCKALVHDVVYIKALLIMTNYSTHCKRDSSGEARLYMIQQGGYCTQTNLALEISLNVVLSHA